MNPTTMDIGDFEPGKGGRTWWDIFKYFYSMCLLGFSITIIMALIFQRQTRISFETHPALAFVAIWFSVLWLSMVEGGQPPMVGLPPVQRDLYKETHPITHAICALGHRGDNLDRYLIGRQFLVVLIVFVTNLAGAPLANSEVLGLPTFVTEVFLTSGVAMILMTTMVGQVNTQVNSSHCMLDFINTHFMTFTLYACLAVEASGLLHCVYLVQMFLPSVSPITIDEPPRTACGSFFFWFRIAISCCLLVYACVVTCTALFNDQTTMWNGIPEAVGLLLFFFLMCVVGMLEGMQIAFFSVTKFTKEEQSKNPIAHKVCSLLFEGDGRNLPAFMVGRQIGVTMCFFIIARITTINVDIDEGEEPLFRASRGLQEFFNTGLLGAIITTTVGSISWQIVASAFPIAFMSNHVCYYLLKWCLFLEWTGVCSGAWVIAEIQKKLAGFQVDEVYIGTPEERKAKQMADKRDSEREWRGHPRIVTYPVGSNTIVGHAPDIEESATGADNSTEMDDDLSRLSRVHKQFRKFVVEIYR